METRSILGAEIKSTPEGVIMSIEVKKSKSAALTVSPELVIRDAEVRATVVNATHLQLANHTHSVRANNRIRTRLMRKK